MSAGVLSKQQVLNLTKPGPQGKIVIHSTSGSKIKVDGSSFDLPIGPQYWEMRGSCRTGKALNLRDIPRKYAKNDKASTLEGDTVLKKGNVYLFESGCQLDLSGTGIEGRATGRSSIGRLDVLVRLLTDKGTKFDRIRSDYNQALRLEVTPITFDILVRPGTCLSQLRLSRGSERLVTLTKEALLLEDPEDFPVVDRDGIPLTTDWDADDQDCWYPFGLDLTSDPQAGCAGFVAKNNVDYPVDPDAKNSLDPMEFWEPVYEEDGALRLQPNRLYILRSKERLRIPGHMALECQAYTETMGEWRIEYAGFAHPWFGRTRKEKSGTPIIFEVRGHNIETFLTDGIPLGNVCFRRMSQPVEEPSELGVYEKQELKLSSCFKPWPAQGV